MKKSKIRALSCLLAVMLCMTVFSTTAFADGGDYYDYELPLDTAESGQPFSEESEIYTRDLLYDQDAHKQFITIQDRDGNTFYIVIDYDSPVSEEEEQYKTYFLNPVDLADLGGLAEDGGETEPAVCICTDKCAAGAVNTTCPVCAVNMTECVGKEKEPEALVEPTAPVEEPAKKNNLGGIVVVLLIVALAGGAAFYIFKMKKNKPKTKGNTNLDDYDYGTEDEDEYEFEPYSPDAEEPAPEPEKEETDQ